MSMKRFTTLISSLLLVLSGMISTGSAQELDRTGSVAFLGIVFLDTSLEGAKMGASDDEQKRIELVELTIAKRFLEEGFELEDITPIQDELENTTNPANCYGCEVRMAQKTNAKYVLVGVVQKVSNLIISMNLVMRELDNGEVVRARSVDVRSNTDQSWLRGMRYIMKTAIFKDKTK